MRSTHKFCFILAALATFLAGLAAGQTTNPRRPSKEYIRMGGRVIAVENACKIGGRVMSGGAGLSGATVSLTGTESDSVLTDASGNYLFAGLRCGGNYTVAASKTGLTFTPPSITYSNLSADQLAANFTAAAVGYTIAGRVTLSGSGLANVTVSLTGSQSASTTTDSNGNYSFSGLTAGDYTVTPSHNWYSFSPPSITYTGLSSDQTAANFTATQITYTVSGRVTSSGAGLSGVTVSLTGSQTGSTTTDSNGNYTLSGLGAGGNYTVTPFDTRYTFNPPSRSYSNLSANQTGADFAATRITYTVSGRVTFNGSGLPNVSVNLTGSQTGSLLTDSNGNYSFGSLGAGGNYTLTPVLATYGFTPPTITYNNLSGDQLAANFTAAQVTYTISGRVTEAGTAVGFVAMSLGGSQSGSTSTDLNGYYTFAYLAAGGTYTVTPTMGNFTFTPPSRTFSNLSANQTADFVGNQYPYAAQVSPSSGTTKRATLTFTFRDPDGYSDMEWTQVSINSTLSGSAGCVLYYSLAYNTQIYLGDNTSNPQWRQATIGSGSAITTSQGMCRLYPVSSSRTLSGTDVILSMDLEFLPAFSGSKSIWMSEKDYAHASYVNWVQMGSRTVPAEISGRVTMGTSGVGSVTMTLSGTESKSTPTDSSGYYAFSVTPGGNYTVTPSKTAYMFTPASSSLSNVTGVRTANFAVKATVSMTNQTRPGYDTDYRVGDSWRISINGPPYQTVTNTATFNGSTSSTSYGQTNGSGTFSMTGVMDEGAIGNWTEVWTVGPVQATPTLNFVVRAPTPTVSITNLTRPGHNTDFRVGDSWRINISGGPPYQTVSVTATFNGGPPSTSSYGQTNSSGSFTMSGTMGADAIGTWTEVWKVGNYQATPTLKFVVNP